MEITSDTDLDITQAKAFEVISNIATPFGINVCIDFIDADKFQLQMQGKVLHEGLIRQTSAHNDPYNPSSRYQITHSAVIIARLQIKLAHQAIGENYAAYKLCDANGRELNGPTLQEAMQDQSGGMLKIDARRVMNPVERGMLSCSYHLTLHSEHSSEPKFFSIPNLVTGSSGGADASQSERLLEALCVDAKHRIYDKSVPLMDTFNRSLFDQIIGQLM